MTSEQFTQVVEAILDGRYSWACVLILRFAGYNPLHYIPHRTYRRLMRENSRRNPVSSQQSRENHAESSSSRDRSISYEINDLSYLESLKESQTHIRGGDRPWISQWFDHWKNLN
ncbi:MAG: HetP family heterocyst commitment protein [Oculatellaceae cyanobacterium Prado106]|nr:HetP family heterocyst commitment protein [Oculatellaceae cyanobacterium Prado106]